MASSLDRYVSYEYLVSPRPESGRGAGAEGDSLSQVRGALERAKEQLQLARRASSLDERASAALSAAEEELEIACVLLDSAKRSWLS
jgi:hypothetical protein